MFTAAKNLLTAESEAIKFLSEHLSENFQKAIDILLNHSGKTIICGMGKSGHIAKKIAATFTSTGQPSVFLHPSEGAHGDLGVYSPGDTTVLISKSGSTDEILCLIPTLRKFKSKIISIVGNTNSPIAYASDVVIDISFAKEADPLNIVPTTSSIVSLAVGDAMAAELMARRKFTKQDFATFHPAGQLGRNLLLRVKDVMSPLSSCAIVEPSSPLREIVIAMTEFPLGAALVVKRDNILDGLVTEGDIRRSLRDESSFKTATAEDIMTRFPKFVLAEDYVGDAVQIMESGKSQINVLPVVEVDERFGVHMAVGLLRLHDTYKHGVF
ncbi:MAG: KpsF/GutQ family sugar-phosphate isomerase [Puniceicoccales bacterium]|jgi:arabinose-5-phosphate isomerase|nr:KpsF/GutQ family sugar-phosphate isomerase [Puniceicoccales bacterium]